MSFVARAAISVAAVALAATLAVAQVASVAPLKTAPIEKFTVNPGHRDWTETVLAGTTIIGGNSSNRGGLFGIDITTGALKWTFRPTGTASSNPFVATKPAVAGGVAIVPMGNTLMAVTIATGREAWRGPRTALSAAAATDSGLAFVLGEDASFHAIDTATGKEKWAVPFPRGKACDSIPVARNGSVYLTRNVITKPGENGRAPDQYQFLVALDANTGEERWRYPAAPVGNIGVCVSEPTVSSDTYYAISDQKLYAISLATGREVWPPVEVRAPVDGRDRLADLTGVVDAGKLLVGVTPTSLQAYDKATGKLAWQLPGQYNGSSPSTAIAGDVLYVQFPRGTLNALDLATRKVLWSFSRPTAEPNWAFGYVTPVDGGLWVDSYQALIKLQ